MARRASTPHPHTYLLSARSVLLPTSMMMTSLPLSVLTSSIHFEVCWKELRSGDGEQGHNRVRASTSRVGGSWTGHETSSRRDGDHWAFQGGGPCVCGAAASGPWRPMHG